MCCAKGACSCDESVCVSELIYYTDSFHNNAFASSSFCRKMKFLVKLIDFQATMTLSLSRDFSRDISIHLREWDGSLTICAKNENKNGEKGLRPTDEEHNVESHGNCKQMYEVTNRSDEKLDESLG